MVCFPTFIIKINQIWVNIPYMDPMGVQVEVSLSRWIFWIVKAMLQHLPVALTQCYWEKMGMRWVGAMDWQAMATPGCTKDETVFLCLGLGWMFVLLFVQSSNLAKKTQMRLKALKTMGYSKDFFIFTPTWGNDPIWLIFFKWVETTN